MYSYRHLVSIKGKVPCSLNSAYWWLVVSLMALFPTLVLRFVHTLLYFSAFLWLFFFFPLRINYDSMNPGSISWSFSRRLYIHRKKQRRWTGNTSMSREIFDLAIPCRLYSTYAACSANSNFEPRSGIRISWPWFLVNFLFTPGYL